MSELPSIPRKRMHRVERANRARYLTFSCYRRSPLFQDDSSKDTLAATLAAMRLKFDVLLIGWVVMPEHVHLIMMPRPPHASIVEALWWLKREVARSLIAQWRLTHDPRLGLVQMRDGKRRVWQAGGGYDRIVRSHDDLLEKLQYIHMNPVRRELVARPVDWAWSSARWYGGLRDGQVPMDHPKVS